MWFPSANSRCNRSLLGSEGRHHGSLRPNPRPRIEAFQQQILSFMRLGHRQAQLTMETLSADPANKVFQHEIDIKVITDGEHHVLDQLDPLFGVCFRWLWPSLRAPSILALKRKGSWLVASKRVTTFMPILKMTWLFLTQDFFVRLIGFVARLVIAVFYFHRIEFSVPDIVDRFFIDGPISENDLRRVIPDPRRRLVRPIPVERFILSPPLIPIPAVLF